MTKVLSILAILAVFSCQPDKQQKTKQRKSRIEQVKDRPYRNLNVNEQLQSSIKDLIGDVLLKSESLDTLTLFYVAQDGEIVKVDTTWNSARDLIDASYEIWRTKDITSTIVTYPGFSQNALTGEERHFYVVEVESNQLTGTCRMLFDEPNPKELNELSYTDRN